MKGLLIIVVIALAVVTAYGEPKSEAEIKEIVKKCAADNNINAQVTDKDLDKPNVQCYISCIFEGVGKYDQNKKLIEDVSVKYFVHNHPKAEEKHKQIVRECVAQANKADGCAVASTYILCLHQKLKETKDEAVEKD